EDEETMNRGGIVAPPDGAARAPFTSWRRGAEGLRLRSAPPDFAPPRQGCWCLGRLGAVGPTRSAVRPARGRSGDTQGSRAPRLDLPAGRSRSGRVAAPGWPRAWSDRPD